MRSGEKIDSLLAAWPWGRGSRGLTPLHLAAEEGHLGVVERLLEAMAAVDANKKICRGLGRGFEGGHPLKAMGLLGRRG